MTVYVLIPFSLTEEPKIFQHTFKLAGEVKVIQKVDTMTEKEQVKQKQKQKLVKEFQRRLISFFQEQQRKMEKDALQNSKHSLLSTWLAVYDSLDLSAI